MNAISIIIHTTADGKWRSVPYSSDLFATEDDARTQIAYDDAMHGAHNGQVSFATVDVPDDAELCDVSQLREMLDNAEFYGLA